MASIVTSKKTQIPPLSNEALQKLPSENSSEPLSDAQWSQFLAEQPLEFFQPNYKQNEGWVQWFRRNPEWLRYVELCTPAQRTHMLSPLLGPHYLSERPWADIAVEALNVMNLPNNLPKFIQLVKDNRDSKSLRADLLFYNKEVFNETNKNPYYSKSEKNPFLGRLPENIRKILEIENRLITFEKENERQPNFQEARQKFTAEIDQQLDAFLADFQPKLSEADRKV